MEQDEERNDRWLRAPRRSLPIARPRCSAVAPLPSGAATALTGVDEADPDDGMDETTSQSSLAAVDAPTGEGGATVGSSCSSRGSATHPLPATLSRSCETIFLRDPQSETSSS